MTNSEHLPKSSAFPEELSEVRSKDDESSRLPRAGLEVRLSRKASSARELLQRSPNDRFEGLIRAALLRKDEALLDGLLEELTRQSLLERKT